MRGKSFKRAHLDEDEHEYVRSRNNVKKILKLKMQRRKNYTKHNGKKHIEIKSSHVEDKRKNRGNWWRRRIGTEMVNISIQGKRCLLNIYRL